MRRILILITAIMTLGACEKDDLSFDEKEKAKVDQEAVFNLVLGEWRGKSIETKLDMKINFEYPHRFHMLKYNEKGVGRHYFDTDDFYYTQYYDPKTEKKINNIYFIHAPSNLEYDIDKKPLQKSLIFKIDKDTMYVNKRIGDPVFSEKDMYILQRVKD